MSNREAISRVEAAEKELALAKKALEGGSREFKIMTYRGAILETEIDYKNEIVFRVKHGDQVSANKCEALKIYYALGNLIGLI